MAKVFSGPRVVVNSGVRRARRRNGVGEVEVAGEEVVQSPRSKVRPGLLFMHWRTRFHKRQSKKRKGDFEQEATERTEIHQTKPLFSYFASVQIPHLVPLVPPPFAS